MDTDLVSRILSSIPKSVHGDEEYEQALECAKRERTQDAIERLLSVPQRERGGHYALSGFLYQFLVTLKYLIAMLDGRWDYVAVELHEDIVCGKDNTIRFVQVKTSKNDREPSKVVFGRDLDSSGQRPLCNSWLDKLFTKERLFNGFDVQYELVTSFVLETYEEVKIDAFTENHSFDLNITPQNGLYRKLKEKCYTKGDGGAIVEHVYADLKGCLSRLLITKMSDRANIEWLEKAILQELTEVVRHMGKFKGRAAGLLPVDLRSILGLLMEKCAYETADSYVLLITVKDMTEIMQGFVDQVRRDIDSDAKENGQIEIVNAVFSKLKGTIQRGSLYLLDDIQQLITTYHDNLENWLRECGSLRMLLGQYTSADPESDLDRNLQPLERAEYLEDLIGVNLLLSFAHQGAPQVNQQHQRVLTKSIRDEHHTGFFRLHETETFSEGVERLRNIISTLSESERAVFQLILPNVILQGNYSDLELAQSDRIDLDLTGVQVKDLQRDRSLAETEPPSVLVVAGYAFKQGLRQLVRVSSTAEVASIVRELWRPQRGGHSL